MEFNVAAPGAGLDSRVPFRGLTPANSRKLKAADTNARPAGPLFSAAEMRHNFALWAFERDPVSGRRLYLCYCVRCKGGFQVEDCGGSVTPPDQKGTPAREPEAAERLSTFGAGPCPGFSHLTGSARLTQAVTCSEVLRGSLAALFHAMSRVWKRPRRGWRRPASLGKGQN